MGVTECDNMLMLLAVSTKMTEKERDVVVPLMMRGFKVNIFCLYIGSTSLVFVCRDKEGSRMEHLLSDSRI